MEEFKFEFVVRAKNWKEVVSIFKDELGFDKKKQNSSDRNIDGYFLVSLYLNEPQLDQSFYKKVRESEKIAILSDKRSEKYRNDILTEVAAVENHLRKLLLHVSDIVDDYYKYFAKTLAVKFVKNENIIASDEIDPMTSHLTLDQMITIFSLDLSSWDRKSLNANDLLEILESGDDLQSVKRKLTRKIERNIVWNHIANNLLKDKPIWQDVEPKLGGLKTLRNKAAHFRTCSKKDSVAAGKLSEEILKLTRKRSQITAQDLQKLRKATYPGFVDALEGARSVASRLADINKGTQSAFYAVNQQTELAKKIALAKPYSASLESVAEALRQLGYGSGNKDKTDDNN